MASFILSPRSVTCSDSVLQRTLIEDVGRKGAECRVHPILDLQADWTNAQHHQALKQRLGQPGLGRLLAHHHGAQLAVVAHKDQLRREAHTVRSSSMK